jgi:hypothetical protein
VIDLLRTLSNPEIGVTLGRLTEKCAKVSDPPVRVVLKQTERRARYGIIQQTCAEVIHDRGRPITVREVHAGVESMLRCSVSYSSVKNAVAGLAKSATSEIRRTEPGIYVAKFR